MATDSRSGDCDRPHYLGPHIRLALLRLNAQARNIRARLQNQSDQPGAAHRSWPWIRATLAHELDLAMERALTSLQALHAAVFDSADVVPVRDIRLRVDAMNGCIGHILALHREIAAALPRDHPARPRILEIIESPLEQLASFIDAMQLALSEPGPEEPAPETEIELRLSIDLDFAAQLVAAESSAATPSANS